SGMTARMKRTAPQTFKLKSDSQSSSLTSSKDLAIDTPALFTRISTRPKRSSVVSSARFTVSCSATSPRMGSTTPPVDFSMGCDRRPAHDCYITGAHCHAKRYRRRDWHNRLLDVKVG